MELIIKTYGKFLLEAVALGLFLMLLIAGVRDEQGNVGVFHMLGAFFEEEQTISGSDFVNCVEESKRAMPQIFYKKVEPLCVGSYDVEEIFGAVDCEGNALPLQIQGVFNSQGIREPEAYLKDTTQIKFDEQGIYTVQICVMDAWNHESICKIRIPVNQ